ncbi:MAG: alpha/beta hydrolase [Ferruginibacter sp.]
MEITFKLDGTQSSGHFGSGELTIPARQPGIFLFLILFIQLSALAQPITKNVLIEGKGIPVVMLNGGTGDMSVFSSHSKQLSADYKVIRMEQFNVQYATEGRLLPKTYSVQMESEALKATLDSLNITIPVVLVGHSYGGLIALDFAIHNPKYIRSLILIEPPVFAIAKEKKVVPEGMMGMQKLLRKFLPQANITEDMIKEFRCELMDCDSFDIYKHPLWQTWVKQKNRLRGLAVINKYKVDCKDLHRFLKPVLIVTGTQTVLFHKKIDALLAGEFPLGKTTNITGGHAAININATEFVTRLKNFLGDEK